MDELQHLEERRRKLNAKIRKAKQRKLLRDAKDVAVENSKLKKQVAELKVSLSKKITVDQNIFRDLKRSKDSLDWTRSAIQNLLNEIDSWHAWGAKVDGKKVALVRRGEVKLKLEKILKGEQPDKRG